jgi:hypothetical protein
MKNIIRATLVATAIIGASSLVLLTGPAKAFEVPFDWSCNAEGTSCRAPGLQPKKQKFPAAFFTYGYPKQIIVQNKDDFDAVNSGWTSKGDCKAQLADSDYPDVAVAKAKFCLFHQKGYNAPKPRIIKGW